MQREGRLGDEDVEEHIGCQLADTFLTEAELKQVDDVLDAVGAVAYVQASRARRRESHAADVSARVIPIRSEGGAAA
jgi:hypothetical protein